MDPLVGCVMEYPSSFAPEIALLAALNAPLMTVGPTRLATTRPTEILSKLLPLSYMSSASSLTLSIIGLNRSSVTPPSCAVPIEDPSLGIMSVKSVS